MRRTVIPIVLLVAAVAAGVLAFLTGTADDAAEGTTTPAAATPVLSPRRVPTWFAEPVGVARLVPALQDVVTQSPADTCLVVTNGDKVVYQHNQSLPVVPASNMKLVTGAIALDVLGPDFSYATKVVGAKPDGSGTVQGDLWLVGGGDPTLATAPYIDHFTTGSKVHTSLEALADTVAKSGVKSVTGRIVGDDSRYDTQRYPDAWPEDLRAQNQSGPISALSVNDGFTSWPAKQSPDADAPVATADPPGHAAQVFADLLRARGITVAGSGAGKAPEGAATIASATSPAMPELLHNLESGSDNETSEAIVKELAVHEGRPGTFADGLDVMRKRIAKLGVPAEGLSVADGSGLSSEDKVTCGALTRLLNATGTTGLLGKSLSVAGKEGTLTDRFTDPSVKGRLRAKTGSLNQVTSLSGFADTAGGTDLTFGYVANGRTYSDALLAIQDDLAAALVAYPAGVPIDQLGPR